MFKFFSQFLKSSQSNDDVCSVCGRYVNPVKSRIFNGINSTYAPWSVFITVEHKDDDGLESLCSGSIIDFKHVLTSAHCFASNLGKSKVDLYMLIIIKFF